MAIEPGAAVSRRIGELLPEVTDQTGGYVYVRANEPLFATSSIWTKDGATLSNFAAQPLTTPFVPAPLTAFAVTGKVTLNDLPAVGFKVVLSGPVGKLATTNAEGLYAFTGLPAGRYSMTVDQFGFQFVPAQTNFEITTASKRQDFQGFTAPDAIVVQPASMPVDSPDTIVSIFGSDFDGSSQAYVGAAGWRPRRWTPTISRSSSRPTCSRCRTASRSTSSPTRTGRGAASPRASPSWPI